MATREIKAYERVQGWLVPFLAVSKKLLPRAILMGKQIVRALLAARTLLPSPAQALVLTTRGSPSLKYAISKIDQHIQTS
jgi:hypothetical protein